LELFFLLSLIFSAFIGLFSLIKQFQMLQQNSYFPSRYFKWLKANFTPFSIFVFFLASFILAFSKKFIVLAIFTLLVLVATIYIAIKNQKKSIKKLVFTARVKRLFIAVSVVYFILILIFALNPQTVFGRMSGSILMMISLVSPLSAFISWAVTLPIEKLFSKYYIKDAKRILKEHKNLKVIGITGSYGKTTTKFILTRILSEKYNVVCTPQSFNTPMGVVRTIREKLKPQTQFFVCEMGAKNVGDIKEICDIVNPDYALITSVGPQHLETFKTVGNVFKTKFELADAVEKKGEKAFVNGDSTEILNRIFPSDFEVYGTNEEFDFKAENIHYGKNGSEFDIVLGNEKVHLTSRLLGLHSIINIAGAAALAYKLGVEAEDIKFAVSSLKPTEHRLELKTSVAGSLLIDDAYNANPEGSLEAVRVLGSFDGMKKVIITPGLIELGEKEYACNYALGLEAADKCDIIIFVGKNRSKPMVDAVNSTEFEKENLFVASSFFEAMEIYSRFADSNTVVLIENDLPDNYLN
jgi:UDP-N-acetylmuramoyl-tripeptide--D-alanyl-D-alanine ligase